MSERPKRRRARIAPGVTIAALVVAAFGGTLQASAAVRASACPAVGSSCERQAPAAAKRTEDDDDLLDKVGLGSLEDLPWETLPVALGLSALIGAAGGFVYSGLVGTRGPGRRSDSSSS